jgi:general secretion pathway protein K
VLPFPWPGEKMNRLLKDDGGFALVLTILIVSLIVTLTLQFNSSMRSDLYEADNLKVGIKLACIARSGFNYACAVLSEDDPSVDFLREEWADQKLLASNSPTMFEEGSFEVRILDHSGKIPVNHITEGEKYEALLKRFLGLEEFGLDSEEISNLIDTIKDWIDADNEVTKFGAENGYYQALDKPYACKNAPLDSLEEMLLVKGITKELFYGTKEKPGISDYLTIYSNGYININTAHPLVLRSLSDQIDQEMVEEMVAYRLDEKNDLLDPKWYLNVPGMSDVNMDDLETTSSMHFKIESEGIKDTMSKRVIATVERKEGTLKVLAWKVE